MIFGNILLFIRCRNQNQIKWTKTQNSQLLFWGISMGIFVKCFIWSINFVLFSQSLVSKSYLQLWICLGFVNSTCCKGHEIRRKRQEDFNLVKIKAIRYEKPKFSEIQFKSIYNNDKFFKKLISTLKIESHNCHTVVLAGKFERGHIRAIRFENPKFIEIQF